jgi:tyrosine-protein kinase Etk/Wzc
MERDPYTGLTGVAIEPDAPVAAPETSIEQQDARPGLFLVEVLTVFASQKRLIAIVAGAGLLVGIALSFLLPTEYTSTGRIMPPQQTQSSSAMLMNQLVGAAGLVPSSGSALLGMRNPNEIYIGMLNSRTIADEIVNQFGLKGVYRARDLVAAREKLARFTSIVSEKSGMISISVTDRDRTRAAQMANAYIEYLRSLTKTIAVTEASQRRAFYEDQLRNAKSSLISAEFQFRQVQLRNGVIQPEAQGRALIGELADLQARIAAKQVDLQAQRSFSTENNPEVQLLESQLESMRQEQARLQHGGVAAGDSAMALRDLAGSGLDYLNAAHELAYRQTLLDLLIKQYDSARLDEAKEAAIIQVVDSPVPPERRSSPHRLLIIILFTVLGGLSGCAYLYMIEIFRSNPRLAAALAAFKSTLLSR